MELVICGGSFKGIIYLGILHYLIKVKHINYVNSFYGVSIGAFIGIMYFIGYKPIDIYNKLCNIDLNNYKEVDFDKFLSDYTLCSGKLWDLWYVLFSEYEDPEITIKEFNLKYSTQINILATCLTTRKLEIFNENNTPDVKVIDAIVASATLPLIFPPKIINNKIYLDGGCKTYIPELQKYIKPDALIINLEPIPSIPIDSIYTYVSELASVMFSNDEFSGYDNVIKVSIPERFANMYDLFTITNDDKTELFLHGIKIGEKFYKNKILVN